MMFAHRGPTQINFAHSEHAGKAPVRSVPGAQRAWNTAWAGTVPNDAYPGELTALIDHMTACNKARGRLFTVRCAFDAVKAILTARFWTTILVVALLICVSAHFA